MRAFWKEPLLHFLLLGGLVFLLYEWRADGRDGPGDITISRGQQENLLNTFSRTWQRPPTPEELHLLREKIDPLGIRSLELLSGTARRQKLREILVQEQSVSA